MKKTATLSALALMAGLFMLITSCNKEITVDYVISDHDTHVNASQFTGTITDTFTLKQTDIKAAFTAAKANFDVKKIKSMVAKGFKAKGKGTADLNGITGVSLFVKHVGSTTERKQIASLGAAPSSVLTEVDLAINGTDLKDLLGDTDLWVITEIYYDKPTEKDVTVTKGTLTFTVKN